MTDERPLKGAFVKHDGNGTITYRLCRRFAESLWGDGTLYDACGLVDGEGNLVVPSVDLGDVDALIEMFAPDFAPFSYVVVDDSLGDCFAGFPSLTNTAPASFPRLAPALLVAAVFAFMSSSAL